MLKTAVFSSEFPHKHERGLPVRPAGAGKGFLAQVLGCSVIRAGHTVRSIHDDDFFKALV